MKPRMLLQLIAVALISCHAATAQTVALNAGPFSVAVPIEWSKTAIVEKIPLLPLYSDGDWKAFKANPMFILKPGYNNRPQHWALRFPEAALSPKGFDPKQAGDDATAPQILIHKANEWGLAFTDGRHEETKAGEIVKKLRTELDDWKTKDLANGSPAFMDAELTFICLKKEIAFNGGRGIRLVCQWNIEADLVRKGRLHYLFLGLSSDDTCQIIATFPLNVDGLPPEHENATHLGRSTKRYEELEKGFSAYESEAKKWLEKNADGMSPKLSVLDDMMKSLSVTHWK